MAVSAEYDGEQFQSTGLSYEDLPRTNVHSSGAYQQRRLETPLWIMDNTKFATVLTEYMERRAFGTKARQKLTDAPLRERLTRACKELTARRPAMIHVLEEMCRRYALRRAQGADPSELHRLSREIKSQDTHVRLLGKDGGAGVVTAILYLYFRCRMSSAAVASELNYHGPHVRQVIWKVLRIARSVFNLPKESGCQRRPRPLKIRYCRCGSGIALGKGLKRCDKCRKPQWKPKPCGCGAAHAYHCRLCPECREAHSKASQGQRNRRRLRSLSEQRQTPAEDGVSFARVTSYAS